MDLCERDDIKVKKGTFIFRQACEMIIYHIWTGCLHSHVSTRNHISYKIVHVSRYISALFQWKYKAISNSNFSYMHFLLKQCLRNVFIDNKRGFCSWSCWSLQHIIVLRKIEKWYRLNNHIHTYIPISII